MSYGNRANGRYCHRHCRRNLRFQTTFSLLVPRGTGLVRSRKENRKTAHKVPIRRVSFFRARSRRASRPRDRTSISLARSFACSLASFEPTLCLACIYNAPAVKTKRRFPEKETRAADARRRGSRGERRQRRRRRRRGLEGGARGRFVISII